MIHSIIIECDPEWQSTVRILLLDSDNTAHPFIKFKVTIFIKINGDRHREKLLEISWLTSSTDGRVIVPMTEGVRGGVKLWSLYIWWSSDEVHCVEGFHWSLHCQVRAFAGGDLTEKQLVLCEFDLNCSNSFENANNSVKLVWLHLLLCPLEGMFNKWIHFMTES